MLVPQRQANLKSDRPRSFRNTVYQYDSRSKPKSKLTGLGANLNQRVAQPPKNVFMQTVKLRQELREQKEVTQSLYPKVGKRVDRVESPVYSNKSSQQSPKSAQRRKKLNAINRDLLVMAAAIDQTITNATRDTLSTPDE